MKKQSIVLFSLIASITLVAIIVQAQKNTEGNFMLAFNNKGTNSLGSSNALGCDMNIQGRIMSNYCNQNSAPMRDKNYIQNCCKNDDDKCFSVCNTTNDNDCLIKQKLEQMHQYLLAHKSPLGYTPAENEQYLEPKTEVYRQIPGSQAIGYLNLYRATGNRKYLNEAQDRLNFIAKNVVWNGDSFDGFLGYAFLKGYEYSCNQTYKSIGMNVANRCLTYHEELNWGMMCALNLGQAYKLTGNQTYLNEARAIVSRTAQYQNDDGSFPHYSFLKNLQRNRGYTAWIGVEMVIYKGHDNMAETFIDINKTSTLLELLTDGNGMPIYEYCPVYDTNTGVCSTCSGVSRSCYLRNDFSSCAIGGCTWTESLCQGVSNSCTSFAGESSCRLNGCNWSPIYGCTGTTISCGLRNYSSCIISDSSGCHLEEFSMCSGTPKSCSTFKKEAICISNGCDWDSVTGCSGTPTDCNSREDYLSCGISNSGCIWVEEVCRGSANSCTSFGSETPCISNGCAWNSISGCSGTSMPCDSRNTSSCLMHDDSGCTWRSPSCNGSGNSCSIFASNTTCTSNGCKWGSITYYDEQSPTYETRGGTGELAADAVVFHKTGKFNTKQKTLNFLFSQQNSDYSFNPTWGYPSPPGQTALWSTPTVVTSDIFFQLSEILQVPDNSR